MEFRVWEEVGVYVDGQRIGPAKKAAWLLGRLLLRDGRPATLTALYEWLWDDPPASAETELAKQMKVLRELLEQAGFPDALQSKDGLRSLKVPDELVDTRQFTVLVTKARASNRGSVAGLREAAAALTQALDLAVGDPLAGVATSRADEERAQLDAARREAQRLAAEVGIELGNHRNQIEVLTRLYAAHPEDAAITCLTARALHLSGRGTDAIAVIARHQEALDESALPISQEIKDMHTRLLRNDPSLQPLARREARASEGRLVVVLKTESHGFESLRSLIPDAFGRDDIAVRVMADHLLCDLPPDITPPAVLDRGLGRLSKLVHQPVIAGIAVDDVERAHDLASSLSAHDRLRAAAGSYLVIAITAELYDLVDRHDRWAYCQADDVNGWVRVPGDSVPPGRTSGSSERQEEKPAQKSYSFVFNGTTSIGTQQNGDAVHHYHLGGEG
ncbi:BTAD domain-containing putative transcriptional regulator [Umezawaea endophytica]|uniref:Bacterial transcriptional activator domain-containing protein n=1 Tax=Umezawaea endophytica TaxID=1654476 RepID=A0A9X2VYJ7_9PSEU|nr:bacterial transcriptional activator domain-containing protein [Umezawaea endophytica]MCS7484567.1 bacterial transcriptional activator domain-containing protein [Umezawaea endophytica]